MEVIENVKEIVEINEDEIDNNEEFITMGRGEVDGNLE